MTEAELLTLFTEFGAINTGNLYWFLSVTFALYTVAYLVGRKLSLGSVIFIIVAYLSFLILVINEMATLIGFYSAIREDLHALQESGVQLSRTATYQLESADRLSAWNALGALFPFLASLGGIGYVIYQYRQGRKK